MLIAQPSTYDKFESCHMLTAEGSIYDNFLFLMNILISMKVCQIPILVVEETEVSEMISS